MTAATNYTFATADQELLLRAALLQGNAALSAWRQWQDAVNWEDALDNGSFRLLPLLYTNLQKQGVDDPSMGKLKGIYRQAWSKNQTLFHEMAGVIKYLQSAGIRTMLLKGAGMSLLYYKNNGARPMADIDVLVPWEQARLAQSLLYRAGWTAPVPFVETDLHYGHAIQLNHSTHGEFDLHWRPLHGFRNRYAEDFWSSALPVKMIDVDTLAPNPTDMLFHAIIHGVPWNPVPSIRWIADAMTLINSPDQKTDWPRLIQSAERHLYGLRLKIGLAYLQEKFHPPIPADVMHAVENLPVTYLEERENRFWMGNLDHRNKSPYNALCANLAQYQRVKAEDGIIPMLGFPGFLRWRLEAKSYPDLIFNGIRLTMEMILSRPFTVKPR